MVSLYRGLDSNMALAEGETSDRVRLLEKALHVSIPGLGAHGVFPVALTAWRRPRSSEMRFEVPGSDVVLVADAYEPHVVISESFAAAATGVPAVHFILEAPMATQEGWLVADDRRRGHQDFGMVSLGFHAARTAEQVEELLHHGGTPNHLSFVIAPDDQLFFGATDAAGELTSGTVVPGEPVGTGWPGLGITVDEFHPRAAARPRGGAGHPPGQGPDARPRGPDAPRESERGHRARAGWSGARFAG